MISTIMFGRDFELITMLHQGLASITSRPKCWHAGIVACWDRGMVPIVVILGPSLLMERSKESVCNPNSHLEKKNKYITEKII